eukprot:TRINITY_DN127_c0_g1_i1.p1 TRINITY_DN127_c0_g1~~TRINITY_DN127_c0_g1_i1.p1  ORF type:complete len:169 (+),score=31.35 TRINITY_DN127_c0_g1_i1:244-750(+)
MDLDEFDEFEMDDMSGSGLVPPRPDKPQRPRSQMFDGDDPLHIDEDDDLGFLSEAPSVNDQFPGMTSDVMSASNFDQFQPPPGMGNQPLFVGDGQGGGGGIVFGGSTWPSRIATCICILVFVIILLMLFIIMVLCVVILLECYNISDDLNNLQFNIKVPTKDLHGHQE